MDFVKREEQRIIGEENFKEYPPMLQERHLLPTIHNISASEYQHQAIPTSMIDQIQQAMQNSLTSTIVHGFQLPISPRQLPNLMFKNDHSVNISQHLNRNLNLAHEGVENVTLDSRRNPVTVQTVYLPRDHKIDSKMNLNITQEDLQSNVLEAEALSAMSHNQRALLAAPNMILHDTNHRLQGAQGHVMVPMPFQIKSEIDEDNGYFYENAIQNFGANVAGSVPMDQIPANSSNINQENQLYAIYGNHIASLGAQPAAPMDLYGRQPQFLQSYTGNLNRETNPQNLVIHRQYDNVISYVADETKRQKQELIEAMHPNGLRNDEDLLKMDSENHPNENTKPIGNDNKNVHYYQHYTNSEQLYTDRSENDAGVQNKMPPVSSADDIAYKSLIVAEYANIKGEYVCFKCNGIFPSKRGLKQHNKNCLDGGEPAEKVGKFSCNQCSYKCQSPAILKIHERTHTGEKPFSCTFCDYKSGQKNNVAKHILVHMKEKPFRCQFCDYRCAQKNNLVVHERTHTGFKPFACTVCDYKTVQKPNLVKHMYLHTDQKPFSCDICNYRCVQKTNLTKHKQRHINDGNGEKSDVTGRSMTRPYRPRHKTFKCEYCQYRSVQKTSLDKHVEFKHSHLAADYQARGAQNVSEFILPDKSYEDASIQGLNLMKNVTLDVINSTPDSIQNLSLRKNEVDIFPTDSLCQEKSLLNSVQIQS